MHRHDDRRNRSNPQPPDTGVRADAATQEHDDEDLDGAIGDIVAFRLALVRKIATYLGQHTRCQRPACRRARRCMGDPPDCSRDAPPVSPEEEARALAEVRRAIAQRRAELGPGEGE